MFPSIFLLTVLLANRVMMFPESDHEIYESDNFSKAGNSENEMCNDDICTNPKCTCFGKKPPFRLGLQDVPQLVMLTFDDIVTKANIEIFKKILGERQNPNQCAITATFFINHEYSDYPLIHELYDRGNDMAVQSISKDDDTNMWRNASETQLRNEILGMKNILSNIAKIPEKEIIGYRAPFLQTAGDTTFKVLSQNGFAYDSSLPTRVHTDPPLWPYTLDFGYPQDCYNEPCPSKKYPGFWVFPMVQWKRTSPSGGVTHCSMMDACTPYPNTKDDTFHYMMSNFNRHYQVNKAPFPVFTHMSWFQDVMGQSSPRLDGLLQFFDEILKKNDVFIVSMKEALDYVAYPVTLKTFRTKVCPHEIIEVSPPCYDVQLCWYRDQDKYMKSCIPCPKRYPWVGNPEGKE